jgi:hypothetical protein
MNKPAKTECISNQQVELFAEFLLPCIAELFQDPKIQEDFQKWKRRHPKPDSK